MTAVGVNRQSVKRYPHAARFNAVSLQCHPHLFAICTEFGRTPGMEQRGGGKDGRDHHPNGFTIWMAGGGIKPGHIYGATDDLGYYAIENIATVYDMWATVLHLMGLDHEQLTYRFGGRDLRLTDVHGNVLRDVIA